MIHRFLLCSQTLHMKNLDTESVAHRLQAPLAGRTPFRSLIERLGMWFSFGFIRFVAPGVLLGIAWEVVPPRRTALSVFTVAGTVRGRRDS